MSAKSRSGRSLEELPQNDNTLNEFYQLTHVFSTNRRFSATASIFSSFEPKRLSKSNVVLRSTPVLTISNYDDEQESVRNLINFFNTKISFRHHLGQQKAAQ